MKLRKFLTAIALGTILAGCGAANSAPGAPAGQAAEAATAGKASEASATDEASEVTAADQVPEEAAAEPVRFDPSVEYTAEDKPVLDTELVSVTITNIAADEEGLRTELQIENKSDKAYSYDFSKICLNSCMVPSFDYDQEALGENVAAGETINTWFKIPASQFDKYMQAAADRLCFSINGTSEDYSPIQDDGDGSSRFSEKITLYPTGKTEDAITLSRDITEEECEFLIDNDDFSFGLIKTVSTEGDEKSEVVGFYVENHTDHDIYGNMQEIYVNDTPVKIPVSNPEGVSGVPTEMDAFIPFNLYAGTKTRTAMITKKIFDYNDFGSVKDLAFKLTVMSDDGTELESKDVEYHFEGTEQAEAEGADEQEAAESNYVNEPQVLVDSDMYSLTVTGYRQNKRGFTVLCEIMNKAEKAYHYTLSRNGSILNQFYIRDDFGAGMSFGESVDVEAGETSSCELTIPAAALENYEIEVVDRASFSISGGSVDDTNAASAAYREGNFDYEDKDERLEVKTVTVYPTGKTEEEINDAVSVKEEDCAAFVSTDNFVLGITKKINRNNTDGVIMAYFENKTDQELFLQLDEISVNGTQLISEFEGISEPKKETLKLPPLTKGFMPLISPALLEKQEITEDISKMECTVYHKENPAQGNQFAHYSETISCDF